MPRVPRAGVWYAKSQCTFAKREGTFAKREGKFAKRAGTSAKRRYSCQERRYLLQEKKYIYRERIGGRSCSAKRGSSKVGRRAGHAFAKKPLLNKREGAFAKTIKVCLHTSYAKNLCQ